MENCGTSPEMSNEPLVRALNFRKRLRRVTLDFGILSFGMLCAFTGCAMTSCAPKAAQSPEAAVDAYVEAVQAGRLEEAYKMLSQESRRDLSFADFKKLVEENPEEIAALLVGLKHQSAPPLVRAKVTTKDGDELTLIYEDGAWRVDESAVDLYSQSDARDALRSFLRAFDNKRYDILLNFVPDEQKQGLTAALLKESWEGEQQLEMEQVVEALRAQVNTATLEVLGDRATMSYGSGGAVELVRERGVWKIEDFQ